MATPVASTGLYVPFDAANSRTAAVNVAFSAIHLLVGSGLCLFGRRAWRTTCAAAVGLAFELLAAAVVFNVVGTAGIKNSYSSADNDLATFGIIVGACLFGFLLSRFLPRKWSAGWWLGWVFLGALAGLSVAFTMMILKSGEDLLIGNIAGRWALVAILAIIGLAAVTMTKWIGATIAIALIGTWLIALGIDLMLNTNRGASLGLRKLLDENSLHQEVLRNYAPALSTKLIFGLSWTFAIGFALLQLHLHKDRWFLPIQPSDQQRSWKHWFLPFLFRSSSAAVSPSDIEKVDDNNTREAEEDVIKASSPHFRQNSTSNSTIVTDGDRAENASLASGSDLRALTRNYRRALEILESEDGHQTVENDASTIAIPIQYRPAPINLEASPRPTLLRPNPSSPSAAYRKQPYGQQGNADDEVPDLGVWRRADSDRGTSYSIPLTNVTSSEYKDRDMFRPPSWTGDLPWNPSMLRGDLDPSTLPRHPQDQQHPAIETLVGHVVPVLAENDLLRSRAAQVAEPKPKVIATAQRKSGGKAEDEYELVNVEGLAQNGKPNLRISQPFQMPYASRPVSREGSPNPLTSLGASTRSIPKAQRMPTRERHLFPSEDDLPDHNPSSPDGADYPVTGHTRLHTSETFVDSPRRSGRDEYTTEVDTSGDDEGQEEASSHASYSISNLKVTKRISPPKWKGKSAQKQNTPTESNQSESDLPIRPITQSDMTPQLQSMPSPAKPRLVYNDGAAASNVASLTGTPRSSGLHAFGQGSDIQPPMPIPRSEISEATVRPSQEQRRSMELDKVAGQQEELDADTRADSKKVRFFDSGSRAKLRDRLRRKA